MHRLLLPLSHRGTEGLIYVKYSLCAPSLNMPLCPRRLRKPSEMWGLIGEINGWHQILACLRPPLNRSTIIITMSFCFSKHLTLWRPFMPVWLNFESTACFQRKKSALGPFDSHSPAVARWHLLSSGWALGLQPLCAKQLPCSIRPDNIRAGLKIALAQSSQWGKRSQPTWGFSRYVGM